MSRARTLGLAATMRDHDAPAVRLRELSGLDRLGDRADLVDLNGSAPSQRDERRAFNNKPLHDFLAFYW